MALLELTVSAQVEAYMNVISVYNESGSRLENSGGELCSVTEMLRDNSKTEYEQMCNCTLAAFSLLILNVVKMWNNSVGPYMQNEWIKIKRFFLKEDLFVFLSGPFRSTRGGHSCSFRSHVV